MSKENLLGQALVEWTLNSETEFVESAVIDKEMKEKILSYGLQYPNPDLAFFKTRYLKVDVANKNRIRAYRTEVEEGSPTIRGKQINFDHKGKHFICGWLLDGKIEGDHMVVYGALFKSVFKEDFETIKSLFKEKKLFVSFEIHRYNGEGKDVLASVGDGTYKITEIVFSGCGLLLKEKPAHPTAQVLKLLASENIILEAEKIVEDYAKKLDDSIIYAEMFMGGNQVEEIFEGYETIFALEEDIELDEEFEQKLIAQIEGEDLVGEEGEILEAKKMEYKERKALKDSDFAVIVYVKNKKTGGKRKIRMYPIHDEAHVRNALARLGQEKPQQTLKQLGVSVEKVQRKVLQRAKKLGMTQLLERYKSSIDENEVRKEESSVMSEEKKEEIKSEEIKEEVKEEKAEDIKEEIKAEENKDEKKEEVEDKKEENIESEENKEEVKEEKSEEIKSEENKVEEEKKEETEETKEEEKEELKAKTKTIIEEVVTTTREEDYADGKMEDKIEVKGNRKVTTHYSDGSTSVTEEKIDNVKTYDYEKVQAKIDEEITKVKKEYEDKLSAKDEELKNKGEELKSKDEEINQLKTEVSVKDEQLKSAKKVDFLYSSKDGKEVDSSFSHIRKIIDEKAYDISRRKQGKDKTE